MRTLIATLATAGLAVFSVSALAADDSVKSNPDPNKPGRAIEESSTVKSNPDPDKPGRTIEDSSTVKTKPDPNKSGRAVEQDEATSQGSSSGGTEKK